MTDPNEIPAGGAAPGLDLLQKWARAPHWRPEEGIALAFGVDPIEVREVRSDHYSRMVLSKKQQQIAHFAELARRAVDIGDLPERARPFQFANWAARIGVRFHGSWAASFVEHTDDLTRERKTVTENSAVEMGDRRDRLIKGPVAQVNSEEEITIPELSQRAREEPAAADEKPLQTRPRETMLKLIIGMAIDAYGYDPRSKRSSTARDIAEDLKKLKIELDQDTVRKYLHEGAQFVSSEALRRKFGPE